MYIGRCIRLNIYIYMYTWLEGVRGTGHVAIKGERKNSGADASGFRVDTSVAMVTFGRVS